MYALLIRCGVCLDELARTGWVVWKHGLVLGKLETYKHQCIRTGYQGVFADLAGFGELRIICCMLVVAMLPVCPLVDRKEHLLTLFNNE